MRIIIIRHAEPDYEHNCITKQGEIEALALKDRLLKEKIDEIYVSPLNRAYLTAKPYLEVSHKSYQTMEWLKEFNYLNTTLKKKRKIAWDFPVKYFTKQTKFYDFSRWQKADFIKRSNFTENYKKVCQEFDKELEKNGYIREKKYYKVVAGNKKTLVFFCHLGLECVLLSHLMSLPSVVIAQHFAPSPSSVSILYTEERELGIAQFRIQCLGDISHLYVKNIPPSTMGRFQENYFDNGRK